MSVGDMYIAYMIERENLSIHEDEFGLVTYKIKGDECFIQDVYVMPGHRNDGVAQRMVKQVELFAMYSGCKMLLTQSDLKANGPELGVAAILKYGFKFLKIEDNRLVLFYKETSNG